MAFSRAPSEALRRIPRRPPTIATVFGLGFCAMAVSKKPFVKAGFGSGPDGIIDEIFGIVEFAVHREAKQANEHLLLLHHDRHRRREHVGAVAADDEIDLVDIEQLGVDAGHGRRVGLVIVIDQLDRASEQAAFGVDVLLPNLLREQRRLAVGPRPPVMRHAVADLDRLAGLRRCRHCKQARRAAPTGVQAARARKRSRQFAKSGILNPPISHWFAVASYRQGARLCQSRSVHRVASPPSTMIVSTSPAPARRKAAARSYSGEVKQATPCSKVGNSMTMKRWNCRSLP